MNQGPLDAARAFLGGQMPTGSDVGKGVVVGLDAAHLQSDGRIATIRDLADMLERAVVGLREEAQRRAPSSSAAVSACSSAESPLRDQEAYSAFLSILETNGMTVIPHGR